MVDTPRSLKRRPGEPLRRVLGQPRGGTDVPVETEPSTDEHEATPGELLPPMPDDAYAPGAVDLEPVTVDTEQPEEHADEPVATEQPAEDLEASEAPEPEAPETSRELELEKPIDDHTVSELRDIAKKNEIDLTGAHLKDDIIARIVEWASAE